jgi:hypothetical protein
MYIENSLNSKKVDLLKIYFNSIPLAEKKLIRGVKNFSSTKPNEHEKIKHQRRL